MEEEGGGGGRMMWREGGWERGGGGHCDDLVFIYVHLCVERKKGREGRGRKGGCSNNYLATV